MAKNRAKDNEDNVDNVEAWNGYFAYPFQTQEVNSPAGNLKDTSLERSWQRKILVELTVALFIWNGYTK